MIASEKRYQLAVAKHKLELLREEEIDRVIEEAERPIGGHRIGGLSPTALLRPRHAGLTSPQEHAMWLQDISRWQGEYLAVLADLERVHAFITENRDVLRQHAQTLEGMIAEHDALMGEHKVLKAKHLLSRRAHERAAELHDQALARVRGVSNLIHEAFPSARPLRRWGGHKDGPTADEKKRPGRKAEATRPQPSLGAAAEPRGQKSSAPR